MGRGEKCMIITDTENDNLLFLMIIYNSGYFRKLV